MLQAIKTEPTPRSAPKREREAALDSQDPAFAGYLAFASSFANLPGPAPAPSQEARPERVEARPNPKRTDPDSERAPIKEKESEPKEERKAIEGQAKDARPEKKDPEAPSSRSTTAEASAATPEAKTPEKPEAAPKVNAEGKVTAQVQASAVPAVTPLVTAAVTESEEALSKVTASQTAKAAPEPSGLAAKSATANAGVASVSASRAQEALEQTAPGVQLRFQFSEGTPTQTAKPALTELLSLPKPEIEAPKLPSPSLRSEAPLAKEVAQPSAPPPIKAPESAAPNAAQAYQSPGTREAVLAAASTKAETGTGKSATVSGVPLSLSGTTNVVKGGTPVPGLESAQSAKSNATFAQVDSSIRWLIKNHEKGAEIQLNPESLGRVVIKLRVEGGEVHARLWASEAATVPILQEHKAALEASLRQQGLSLGSFDLQQGRRGDDASQRSQSPASGSGAGIATSLEKKQDLPIVAPALLGGAHLLEVIA